MVKLSKKEVEHIAKLARLCLSEEEKQKFARHLSSILNYVDQLKKIDTKGVEPIGNIVGLSNVFRKDRITPSSLAKKLLDSAPETKDRYLKIKGVKETWG